jgi:poly(A) polymerase
MKGVEEVDGQFHKDNFLHTLKVVDNISRRPTSSGSGGLPCFMISPNHVQRNLNPGPAGPSMPHEFIGAKMIPGVFRKMKLPLNEKMKYVQKLVQLHLRPIVLSQEIVTDSAVRRLIFDAGDDLEDLMTLCEADITSKNERTVKRHLRNFGIVRQKVEEIEEKDSIRNFQPPITGDDIQSAFGIPPSKAVGIIKNRIKDAILDGEIPNEFEAAYGKMLEAGKDLGLSLKQPLSEKED